MRLWFSPLQRVVGTGVIHGRYCVYSKAHRWGDKSLEGFRTDKIQVTQHSGTRPGSEDGALRTSTKTVMRGGVWK
ncbi:hypothetical protein XELAEV_18043852mg [Xenopus laevis]|uniref:Uncharacterized protein n=1 Tax=Xenopus laevis TaxID=8355 RepID=A0A974H373_XENLA|nr:hypothetical protein XELAEV_18043852mg [Xenopus laevis]